MKKIMTDTKAVVTSFMALFTYAMRFTVKIAICAFCGIDVLTTDVMSICTCCCDTMI